LSADRGYVLGCRLVDPAVPGVVALIAQQAALA
jgi:hypothetical protein